MVQPFLNIFILPILTKGYSSNWSEPVSILFFYKNTTKARGSVGEKIAEKLGNAKESFDYYYNQAWKGLSKQEAHKDRIHDKTVNKIGRQREKSGLYKNSKEGCKSFRVRGINDKY